MAETHTAENDAPRDWIIEHRGALVPLTYAEYADVFDAAYALPGRALNLMDGYLVRVTPPATTTRAPDADPASGTEAGK